MSLVALSMAVSLQAFAADSVSGQFREWGANTVVSRSMTLRDLGFTEPVSLRGQDNQRELYLPVPAGVATRNAQLQLVDERLAGRMPATLDFAEATALPLVTLTAWELLFQRMPYQLDGRRQAGQTLLIIGGAGGVGAFGSHVGGGAGSCGFWWSTGGGGGGAVGAC